MARLGSESNTITVVAIANITLFLCCRYNLQGTDSNGIVSSNYYANEAAEVESQEERWQFEPENRRLSTPVVEDVPPENETLSSPAASLHLTLAMTTEDNSEETEE